MNLDQMMQQVVSDQADYAEDRDEDDEDEEDVLASVTFGGAPTQDQAQVIIMKHLLLFRMPRETS